MRKMKECTTAQDEGRENKLCKSKKDSGNGQRKWTRERGGITAETKEREVAKQREKNSQFQGLRELTKQRGRTTSEAKNRKNGLKNEKEQQLKPKTEIMDETERKKWTNERINQAKVRNDSGN